MILTLARRGMLAHKRRLLGLIAAIALGVAFLTGTLVLGDTMRASFNDVFATANAGVDAVVQGKTVTSGPRGDEKAGVPADLVDELQDVPGVRTIQPTIDGLGQIVGKDDEPIGGNGPPTLAGNWIDNPELNPQRIAEGTAPQKKNEAVIDAGSAQTGKISVGDRVEILLPEPVKFTVTGLTKYGEQNSLGGTTYVGLTYRAAEKYLGTKGEVSSIILQADEGVTPEDLVTAVDPLLPKKTEVITGEELTEQQNQEIQGGFLNFFTLFLVIFAVIAVIVSAFTIYNTFSVITAQKTRESALLRAVGASRGQVLGAVAGESLLIGVLASVVGAVLGIGVAALLVGLFKSLGAVLDSAELVIKPYALGIGVGVGVLVTLVAAIFPALRASRVPPLAALRDVAVEGNTWMPVRAVLGALLILGGVAATVSIAGQPTDPLPRAAAGAAAAFIGFVVFGPVAARPTAAVVGYPIAVVRGVSGRMARGNAMRNPRRTAATATALMVGVAVVVMFTIFASSVQAAIRDNFVGQLKAEYVLSTNNFSGAGFDAAMVRKIKELPDVAAVSTLDPASAIIDGEPQDVTVVSVPGFDEVTGLATGLTRDGLAIDAETADELDLQLGDRVTFEEPGAADESTATAQEGETPGRAEPRANTPQAGAGGPPGTRDDAAGPEGLAGPTTGEPREAEPAKVEPAKKVTIISVYPESNLVSGIVVPRALFSNGEDPGIYTLFILGAPEAQAAAQKVADRYKAGDVQTREQFADEQAGQIDQLLGIIYALLVLAIIIALIGIANTLSLSVFERTRELGLLRAVGQTRGQMRAMVRWESVIIAVFGTIGGVGLGVLLGWALFAAVAETSGLGGTMSLPVGNLIAIAVVGALVGVLAGWRPASRAARLNVLTAIANE